jgi:hypothetical protein
MLAKPTPPAADALAEVAEDVELATVVAVPRVALDPASAGLGVGAVALAFPVVVLAAVVVEVPAEVVVGAGVPGGALALLAVVVLPVATPDVVPPEVVLPDVVLADVVLPDVVLADVVLADVVLADDVLADVVLMIPLDVAVFPTDGLGVPTLPAGALMVVLEVEPAGLVLPELALAELEAVPALAPTVATPAIAVEPLPIAFVEVDDVPAPDVVLAPNTRA